MVAGYVVMRIAMVLQWGRGGPGGPRLPWRPCLANIRWTVVAQAGWVVLAFVGLPVYVVFAAFIVLGALELALPVFAQGAAGGTPWHPHHMAERYSLFAIIVLGESVVGTVASSGELLGGADGTAWTGNAIAVVVVGVGLTFGMWWVYFTTPFGDVLEHRRNRGYLFGTATSPCSSASPAPGPGCTWRASPWSTTRRSPARRSCSPWPSPSPSTFWSSTCCTPCCSRRATASTSSSSA
ncbi:hypothetical protein SCALM49S_07614 [Streptomyces californicus]